VEDTGHGEHVFGAKNMSRRPDSAKGDGTPYAGFDPPQLSREVKSRMHISAYMYDIVYKNANMTTI
jgi:hypothetical protein